MRSEKRVFKLNRFISTVGRLSVFYTAGFNRSCLNRNLTYESQIWQSLRWAKNQLKHKLTRRYRVDQEIFYKIQKKEIRMVKGHRLDICLNRVEKLY